MSESPPESPPTSPADSPGCEPDDTSPTILQQEFLKRLLHKVQCNTRDRVELKRLACELVPETLSAEEVAAQLRKTTDEITRLKPAIHALEKELKEKRDYLLTQEMERTRLKKNPKGINESHARNAPLCKLLEHIIKADQAYKTQVEHWTTTPRVPRKLAPKVQQQVANITKQPESKPERFR